MIILSSLILLPHVKNILTEAGITGAFCGGSRRASEQNRGGRSSAFFFAFTASTDLLVLQKPVCKCYTTLKMEDFSFLALLTVLNCDLYLSSLFATPYKH